MMSHSPRDRSSGETMPGKPGPGPSEQRREKFLQRVVEQIEVDRLCRTLKKHFNAKEFEESPPAQRSLGRREVFRGQRDGRADDGADDRQASGHVHRRALKKHNGSPRSADSSPLPPSLDQHGRGPGDSLQSGNEARSSRRPNGKGKARKVPRITVESPRQEDAPSSEDRQVIHVPLSSCPSHRQTPSGPFYGVNSGHANPALPAAKVDKDPGPPRMQMFSWKICTPTNWKRAKSYHEILLERKLLRRNGKQPSQSRFYSVFALRDSRKVTARDRIRRVLRRARFYGDDIKRLPLLRFRRAVRTLIALLKTVKLSRDKGKGLEPSAWIDDDDFRTSRRAHGTLGITFDVFSYRARKEIQVSNEAKAILSMAPGTRSEEQQHVALVSLSQAVPEFGEFPIAMQEALVRVGWYENFEARRIIIREGHMADNFYLILSGSAVVTIREQNGSGDYFGRTAAVLQKGNSFGELALIYGGKRSATVTCKDTVELLAVGRDDYIDIFMHKTKDGAEPDHIKFLKQIKVFCGWPIHALPLDDPSVFLYTYVRRGMVLCKDSNKCEWIYVIKSGSCRVLTALQAVRPSIQSNDRWDHTKDVVPVSGAGGKHAEDRRCAPFLPPVRRVTPFRSRDHCSRSRGLVRVHTFTRTHRLPSINSRSDHEMKEAATKHLQQLDQIWKKRNTHPAEVNELPNGTSGESRGLADESKQRSKSDRIFVNLQTLQAKDVYGLEPVVMSVFKQPTSTSLVSDGAECIMIHKRFFLQKLTEDVAKKIRKEIRPLPSVEVLQQKLQTKTDWDTYRAIAVADFVDFRKYVQDFLDV